MDWLWVVLGSLMLLAGLTGCLMPVLPGPPLAYIGLLLLQLREEPAFSTRFLIIMAVVTLIVTVLDYLIPVFGTKKMGGTKYGLWGCAIGLLFGFWFGPIGIILGPFLGALIGELLAKKNTNQALKAALGSFAGFLFSTLLKLVLCIVMGWYFVSGLL